MSDTNERSVASTGSVCEPVAYQAVDEYGRPFGYAQIVLPFGEWPKSHRVALYRQPQPTLTDAERKAATACAEICESQARSASEGQSLDAAERWSQKAATLRALLERMK